MHLFKIAPIVAILFLHSCGPDTESVKVEKRDWVESIYASSKVQSANQYAQYPEVAGRLVRYHVQEGDTVKAGQLIAELDGVDLGTRLKIAQAQEAQIAASRLKIRELELQITTTEFLYKKDSIDYFRQKRLYETRGVGSLSALETRQLKFKQSTGQLMGLKTRLKALKEEINAQSKQSSQNVELAKSQLRSYQIYAYQSGRIYEMSINAGELVSPQRPIALIGDVNKFLVEMEIDERDISRIKIGQEVVVKLDAYPNTIRAEISRISPNLDPGTQTFHAEAVFIGEHDPLYPGLTAESNIILKTRKETLVIPVEALTSDSTINTTTGEKTIKTGLRNTQYIEVLSGIDENTEILIPNEK